MLVSTLLLAVAWRWASTRRSLKKTKCSLEGGDWSLRHAVLLVSLFCQRMPKTQALHGGREGRYTKCWPGQTLAHPVTWINRWLSWSEQNPGVACPQVLRQTKQPSKTPPRSCQLECCNAHGERSNGNLNQRTSSYLQRETKPLRQCWLE